MSNFLHSLGDWFRYGNTKILGGMFLTRTSAEVCKYTEGDHSMMIGIPVQSGNPQVAIYARDIGTWLPPYDQEQLTAVDKERILNNICDFFDRNSVTYEVV